MHFKNSLEKKIFELKRELYEKLNEKPFLETDIYLLSQKLDLLILAYQKRYLAKNKIIFE
ncbi:aspartyl-phosphate phosphatase Spo0E family protein [Thermovenabulum sp.]|uniref:aspartyl-phosphate phosphatase Spo0E family protein n=1 Tax=Thermovenabulum sp. TaxID=3100335 RepID=UPI003C7B6A96